MFFYFPGYQPRERGTFGRYPKVFMYLMMLLYLALLGASLFFTFRFWVVGPNSMIPFSIILLILDALLIYGIHYVAKKSSRNNPDRQKLISREKKIEAYKKRMMGKG